MIKSDLKFLWPLVVILIAVVGCFRGMHSPPFNAAPSEKAAIAQLQPFIETISWNEDGRVATLSIVGDALNDELVRLVLCFPELWELSIVAPIVVFHRKWHRGW